MREKPRDIGRLLHIMQAIENIEEFTVNVNYEMFMNQKILFFAIVKNVEIIGEAVYMLTKEFKQNRPEIPWEDIARMRHILVHDYYNITPARVWDTINNDIPELRPYIVKYINELSEEQ